MMIKYDLGLNMTSIWQYFKNSQKCKVTLATMEYFNRVKLATETQKQRFQKILSLQNAFIYLFTKGECSSTVLYCKLFYIFLPTQENYRYLYLN